TLGITNPDGMFFLTADALGSTTSVYGGSGGLVTDYTYSAFGAMMATNAAFQNQFQFVGRENDGVGGLYYYRARYYHPVLGRFISEDPIGLALANLNLYGYVDNDPLNLIDPTGLKDAFKIAGGTVTLAIGVAGGV